MIDIRKYETMAMLELGENERESLGERVDVLVESFKTLDKINVEGVDPLVSVLNIHTVLREDISEKILARDEIMANAPEQYDGYFRVPGTLD